MKRILKTTLLFFLLFNCAEQVFAQAPDFLWAVGVDGAPYKAVKGIAKDVNGNVVIVGWFSSPTLSLGAITLTNTNSINNFSDIFIAKYDALGNVLWAKSIVGASVDHGWSVSTDLNNNIFIVGDFFSNSIVFGTFTLSSSGNLTMFIAKYDASGNVLWVKQAEGAGAQSVSADINGNAVVTGILPTTAVFGTTTLTNSSSATDVFLVKYDPSGNVLWVNRAGGSSNDEGVDVSTDKNGNILVTGDFISPTFSLGTTTLTNTAGPGNPNAFLLKYTASGNLLWAKSGSGGTNNTNYGLSVSTDQNDNVIISGAYTGSISFGTSMLINTGSAGSGNIFLLKYDALGNEQWAQTFCSNTGSWMESISADINGNIYATGAFYDTLVFGTNTLTNVSSAGENIFIVKYDASGNALWAKSTGGTFGEDIGIDIVSDNMGNAYVTGVLESEAVPFGTTTLTTVGTPSNTTLFLAKFGSPTLVGLETPGSGHLPFEVYPNPGQGIFSMKTPEDLFSIEVTNFLGKRVYHKYLLQPGDQDGQHLEVDLSEQPAGIYILQVNFKKGSGIKKIGITK